MVRRAWAGEGHSHVWKLPRVFILKIHILLSNLFTFFQIFDASHRPIYSAGLVHSTGLVLHNSFKRRRGQ